MDYKGIYQKRSSSLASALSSFIRFLKFLEVKLGVLKLQLIVVNSLKIRSNLFGASN